MGFPSKIQDAPILDLLLDNCDQYPYAEERRLFYVALTRAKKKVILIGEKRALMAGIHKNDSTKRNTQLAERIKMYVDEFSGKDDTE